MISLCIGIPHFPSQIYLIYHLFRNVVLVLTIRNGRFRRANGLLCFVVLSRMGSHCGKLRVIMVFRMRLCGEWCVLHIAYKKVKSCEGNGLDTIFALFMFTGPTKEEV